LSDYLIREVRKIAEQPTPDEMRERLQGRDPYVALAEALAAPLLTYDGKLAGALGHRATIELVAN
jgi:hypothetical protein